MLRARCAPHRNVGHPVAMVGRGAAAEAAAPSAAVAATYFVVRCRSCRRMHQASTERYRMWKSRLLISMCYTDSGSDWNQSSSDNDDVIAAIIGPDSVDIDVPTKMVRSLHRLLIDWRAPPGPCRSPLPSPSPLNPTPTPTICPKISFLEGMFSTSAPGVFSRILSQNNDFRQSECFH